MDRVGNSDGLWDWDVVTNRVHYSPRWAALTGAEDHEVCTGPNEWFLRVHPEDVAHVSRELEAARKDGVQAFEFRHRMRHKDGSYRWMVCRGIVLRDAAGEPVRLTGSHADVTGETVADPVTGLPSRVLLLDRLARALDRDSRYGHLPFAVVLLGLERPAAGRQADAGIDRPLLTAVARRLETCLRDRNEPSAVGKEDLVARLEDDHFAILLEGLTEIADSKVVADRILGELRPPVTLGGRQVYVSASIGIAVSVTGYTSADAVLRDAHTALHRARALGGARSEIFDTAVLRSEQTAVRLEGDMRGALERKEFAVVYQPIVSLATHRIVGFEALVRWRHPTLGLVGPLDFIPAAERNGFIVPLGLWVLRQACAQLHIWREAIPTATDLWMSVNLSSVQLKDPAIVDDIRAAVRDSEVNPRALMLELTEGVACENPTAVKTVLMQLRAMGIRISIDDFGNGYSSLSYLQQLPVDALKIDRSFVRRLKMEDDSVTIIGTMTRMARQLGLHVVAEGIENEEQLPLLRSLPCESGQGYLFARPLDVDGATEILKSGVPSPRTSETVRADVNVELSVPVRAAKRGVGFRGRGIAVVVTASAVLATTGIANRCAAHSPNPDESFTPRRAEVTATTGSQSEAVTPPLPPGPTEAARTEKVESGGAPRRSITPPANKRLLPSTQTGDSNIKAFQVQHLHRFGSCAGRLVLSRKGLMFTPEESSSKDGIVLTRTELLPSMNDRTLTIRSKSKTYRFRLVADAQAADANARLRELIEAIERFR
jgi:PAS domain S-box-containing protein